MWNKDHYYYYLTWIQPRRRIQWISEKRCFGGKRFTAASEELLVSLVNTKELKKKPILPYSLACSFRFTKQAKTCALYFLPKVVQNFASHLTAERFLDFLTAIKRIFQPFWAFLFTWMTEFLATLWYKWNRYPFIYLKQEKVTPLISGGASPLSAIIGRQCLVNDSDFFSFWKTKLNPTKSLCVTSDDIL